MRQSWMLAVALAGAAIVPAFGSTLCTSFTPTVINPGVASYTASGPVCTIDGITLGDLNYTFDFNATTNNPGLITITVVDTVPYQWKLVVSAANGWVQNGGTDENADFSILYTLQPGGATTNPWGSPPTYVPEIVSAQMKAVGDSGWDPSTDPNSGGFTGEVQGTDAFTVLGYPLKTSNIPTQDPPSMNAGSCLSTYTCNPFTAFGPTASFNAPPVAQSSTSTFIHAEKDILLEGGDNAGDYAKITRVDQIYTLASPVPEPISLILIGGGLIGISILSRKRARVN